MWVSQSTVSACSVKNFSWRVKDFLLQRVVTFWPRSPESILAPSEPCLVSSTGLSTSAWPSSCSAQQTPARASPCWPASRPLCLSLSRVLRSLHGFIRSVTLRGVQSYWFLLSLSLTSVSTTASLLSPSEPSQIVSMWLSGTMISLVLLVIWDKIFHAMLK